jgi:GNAT superfamily N-acetyltransferase
VSPSFLPVTEESIPRVLEMAARLYAQGGDPWDAQRARRAMLQLIAAREHGAMWLIDAGGRSAGYLVLTVCYSLEFGGRFGLLDELYLEEPYRGAGLGAQAMAFAEAACRERGWQALRLEVGHGNARALALYQGRGFRIEDRHLMTKWL